MYLSDPAGHQSLASELHVTIEDLEQQVHQAKMESSRNHNSNIYLNDQVTQLDADNRRKAASILEL